MRQRVRYRFDNLLARGTSATLVWLGLVTTAAVVVSSLLLLLAGVTLAGSEDGGWLEDIWQSLLRVLDTGTMASDVGWGRRLLALMITVFGLLVAGTLIGIIAAGVEDRIAAMRRGRSVVIESGHIVVLGASPRLPVLLRQLVLAGLERRRRTIVVLADLDPAEIHAATRRAADRHLHTKIVYRSGDPTDPADLELARLATAEAVIVLSDGRSDAAACETVLAIGAQLGGFEELTVAVELIDDDTAQRLRRAYGTSIHPIVTAEAVARTVAFALRQRGLSQVVDELLDFQGCDLHVVEVPELAGATFGRALLGLANARPIGLQRADGRIELSPPSDARFEAGDRVVMVADDPRTLELVDAAGDSAAGDEQHPVLPQPQREQLVVLGWNDLGAQVLTGWATGTASASEVVVIVDPDEYDLDAMAIPDLGQIPVTPAPSRDVITAAIDRRPTTLVLLTRPDGRGDADIRTILDLAAVHREFATAGVPLPRLVVELHDAEHRALIDLIGPDDLIISDAMGSQFLAQLADQPVRRDILLELFAARHVTIRLVPCDPLGLVGEHRVSEVIARGAARDLLVIGWRRSVARGGQVTLNPHLGTSVRLETGDELVVIG